LTNIAAPFSEAYAAVAGAIRLQLGLEPTGRPAKSTTSIAEKLRRESIRLSQIQDIAGCRLIVSDAREQDRVVASLRELFPFHSVVDRRHKPSHGYRAVHVIAKVDKKGVEIQVRTALQQLWAEVSEKLSDVMDPAIKYGGGAKKVQQFLAASSVVVAKHEEDESQIFRIRQELTKLSSEADLTPKATKDIMRLQRDLDSVQEVLVKRRGETVKILQRLIENPPGPKVEV